MQPVSLDYRRLHEADYDRILRGRRSIRFHDHGRAFRLYDSHILGIKGLYQLHRGF